MRVLSIILCFSIFISSYSQSKTKKINFSSKQSKGITKKDKSVLILWNQVVFKHNNSIMYCDSATYDRGNNSFIAYSNIKIVENDSMKLYGDSLHYFGNEEKAYLYGNVKLITNQILMNANSLIYDQNNNYAYYDDGGIIKHHGKNYTINSKVGIFNSINKILFFKKNVRLEHIDYQIFSDTLVYHTETEKTNIIGDTKIKSRNSTIS
ncbi:MAG: OstA-like protein, partial [Bacteroidota bacterium]|nr:OstA-like protein [Bacteroidota bacterium]